VGALDQPQPRPHCDRDRTATARHLPFPCSERATSARSSRPGCWWRVVFDRRLARGVAVARASASATVSIPCEGGPRWRPHGAVTGVGWGDAVTVRLRRRWLCGCGGGGCADAVAVAVLVQLRWLYGCGCGGCAGAVAVAVRVQLRWLCGCGQSSALTERDRRERSALFSSTFFQGAVRRRRTRRRKKVVVDRKCFFR